MLTCWAASNAAVGRIEEARAKASELLSYDPEFSLARANRVWSFHSADDLKRLLDGLRTAGVPE